MIRIFLATTHTAAILQAIYAKKTASSGVTDILFLDAFQTKESLLKLIRGTSTIYQWQKIVDFSTPVPDTSDVLDVNLKKSITRKIKHWPGIKIIYNFLIKRYLKKLHENQSKKILHEVGGVKHGSVQLHFHTHSSLNAALIRSFPNAQINYFEHGLGDYFHYEEGKIKEGNFYCVFAEEFRSYLQSKNHPWAKNVRSYVDQNDFPEAVKLLIEDGQVSLSAPEYIKGNKKFVLLLLDTVEVYNVGDNFWNDFIDLSLARINNYRSYKFIVKPHHRQSVYAIEKITDYLKTKEVDFFVFRDINNVSAGAEAVFGLFYHRTDYVFSTFSSALYYISRLYSKRNNKIQCIHAYEFFQKYTANSPRQFTEIYNGLGPLVKNVFSAECEQMTEKN